MGGLGPGIGGLEILVIGLLALIVVGPKDLPLMMRKVGQFLGRARSMAAEFRASFDEMARQSELDELRKEVEALRNAQAIPLGAEVDEAFRDIDKELNAPAATPPATEPAPQPALPEPEPVSEPAAPKATPRPRAKAAPKSKSTASRKATAAKPRVTRKKAVDL